MHTFCVWLRVSFPKRTPTTPPATKPTTTTTTKYCLYEKVDNVIRLCIRMHMREYMYIEMYTRKSQDLVAFMLCYYFTILLYFSPCVRCSLLLLLLKHLFAFCVNVSFSFIKERLRWKTIGHCSKCAFRFV